MRTLLRACLAVAPVAMAALMAACSRPSAPVGAGASGAATSTASSTDRPVRMYFVPSMETGKVMANAKPLTAALEQATGLQFDVEIPPSYAAVIEALGANKADVAWLPTFAYVLAHEEHGVEVALQVVRDGEREYYGMFVARGDKRINRIEDIAGKTIAYTDPSSTSGHVYPAAMLRERGIEPSQRMYAGSHPAAVLVAYTGKVDVACAYYSKPLADGKLRDARKDILDVHSDAGDVLRVIALTDPIPNDTVSFRSGFPKDQRNRIVRALEDYVKTEAGLRICKELYAITDFAEVDDSAYDPVREKIASSGMANEELMKALEEKLLPKGSAKKAESSKS